MQQMIFIADLISCSTCFGHHYAHHQELKNIIHVVAACRLSVCCGAEGYVSGLRAAATHLGSHRDPKCVFNFLCFFERKFYKSNYIIFISS